MNLNTQQYFLVACEFGDDYDEQPQHISEAVEDILAITRDILKRDS
jgi:hypothetical protein